MPVTRLFAKSLRARAMRGLAAAIPVIGTLALVPATADALTVTVAFPDSVTVGQAGLTAHLTMTNTNDLSATVCNAGECNSQGIILVPSCGAADGAGTCKTPDLGVFSFASSATIPLGSCGGLATGFTVAVDDPVQGTLALTPVGGAVVLGPAQTATATCDISLSFGVLKQPALDVDPTAGVQTFQSASARARIQQASGATVLESGAGRDVTTVLPTPVVVPPPVVPPPVVPPPVVAPLAC